MRLPCPLNRVAHAAATSKQNNNCRRICLSSQQSSAPCTSGGSITAPAASGVRRFPATYSSAVGFANYAAVARAAYPVSGALRVRGTRMGGPVRDSDSDAGARCEGEQFALTAMLGSRCAATQEIHPSHCRVSTGTTRDPANHTTVLRLRRVIVSLCIIPGCIWLEADHDSRMCFPAMCLVATTITVKVIARMQRQQGMTAHPLGPIGRRPAVGDCARHLGADPRCCDGG